MIEEFNLKAQIVRKFMESQNMDFLIVGSGALLMCGIPLSREPHDVDIEVICTKEQEQKLKVLHEANDSVKGSSPNCPYIFKIKDIPVNVWVVDEFTHKHTIKCDNIKYATVSSVLQKKMSYKRSKDFQDLLNIVTGLMDYGK